MKKIVVLFLVSLCNLSAWAQESDWVKSFNIVWESRWQQSGYPLSAVRWPMQDKAIKYSINASASSSNASRTREALEAITKVLEWKAIEVPAGSEEAQIEACFMS
jgi:hypothetical protein